MNIIKAVRLAFSSGHTKAMNIDLEATERRIAIQAVKVRASENINLQHGNLMTNRDINAMKEAIRNY